MCEDCEREENRILREALANLVAVVERDDNPRTEGHFQDSEEMQAARRLLVAWALVRMERT